MAEGQILIHHQLVSVKKEKQTSYVDNLPNQPEIV